MKSEQYAEILSKLVSQQVILNKVQTELNVVGEPLEDENIALAKLAYNCRELLRPVIEDVALLVSILKSIRDS